MFIPRAAESLTQLKRPPTRRLCPIWKASRPHRESHPLPRSSSAGPRLQQGSRGKREDI